MSMSHARGKGVLIVKLPFGYFLSRSIIYRNASKKCLFRYACGAAPQDMAIFFPAAHCRGPRIIYTYRPVGVELL